MAKVFGLHHIALRPGVTLAEFEAFLQRALPSIAPWPRVKSHILVADRGHFTGQLLHLLEFDDVETRNRYFPVEGTPGEALQRLATMGNVIAEWQQYATFADGVVAWSDYVPLGEF
jgi:hypothetical protein